MKEKDILSKKYMPWAFCDFCCEVQLLRKHCHITHLCKLSFHGWLNSWLCFLLCLNSAVPTEPCMKQMQCDLWLLSQNMNKIFVFTNCHCYNDSILPGGEFKVNIAFTHSNHVHVSSYRS